MRPLNHPASYQGETDHNANVNLTEAGERDPNDGVASPEQQFPDPDESADCHSPAKIVAIPLLFFNTIYIIGMGIVTAKNNDKKSQAATLTTVYALLTLVQTFSVYQYIKRIDAIDLPDDDQLVNNDGAQILALSPFIISTGAILGVVLKLISRSSDLFIHSSNTTLDTSDIWLNAIATVVLTTAASVVKLRNDDYPKKVAYVPALILTISTLIETGNMCFGLSKASNRHNTQYVTTMSFYVLISILQIITTAAIGKSFNKQAFANNNDNNDEDPRTIKALAIKNHLFDFSQVINPLSLMIAFQFLYMLADLGVTLNTPSLADNQSTIISVTIVNAVATSFTFIGVGFAKLYHPAADSSEQADDGSERRPILGSR